MENSYIERYQVKNLQLEAQLKNERNSLERLSQIKKNEEQLFHTSQNRFSEIKKQVLLSRVVSHNPKDTLIKTRSLLVKLSQEANNLKSKQKKLTEINCNLQTSINHLKDLESRQEVIVNCLKAVKLKKQLSLDSKQSEELLESRYLSALQFKESQSESESIKKEALEDRVLIDAQASQSDKPMTIIQLDSNNFDQNQSRVINSDLGQSQSQQAHKERDSNPDSNNRDSKRVDYQEKADKKSNAKELQFEKNAQSITIEYVNGSGNVFDIQITGQGQQWVEVSIDPKECRDLKVLRLAKAEIVRSLQAKGLKVSTLILGNIGQDGSPQGRL